MSGSDKTPNAPVEELTSGAFPCVNCGAQVTFGAVDETGEETELEQATCAYCDVVNDRALAELRRRNAHERHSQRLKDARRKAMQVFVLAAVAAVLLLTVIAATNTRAALSATHSVVESSRAQVTNVRERQAAVVKRYAHAPAGREHDAELSGAENRVRIERARYDKAAAAYNAQVGSPWAGLCARAFGLPAHVPPSNKVQW